MILSTVNNTASVRVTSSVFIRRGLRHSLRSPEVLVMAIAFPIMLMLMFTYIFGGAIDPSGNYVNYVVPGIILLCAAFGSSSTAADVADDMTNGIIERFQTMPIKSIHVITGHVVASLARNLLATGIVFGVAFLVGFRSDASFMEWLGAIGIISLFILAFTWLFAAIGLVASNPAAAGSYGFALLFLPYVSSAFVPTETMPTWIQGVAENQPMTPIIEAIRGLINGQLDSSYVWWALGWCLIILIGSYVWSKWTFQRKTRRR